MRNAIFFNPIPRQVYYLRSTSVLSWVHSGAGLQVKWNCGAYGGMERESNLNLVHELGHEIFPQTKSLLITTFWTIRIFVGTNLSGLLCRNTLDWS
ncbi:unnamed protein product, partial [Dicrocoelium dendriticum]